MNAIQKIEIQLAKKNAEYTRLCWLYFNAMPMFKPTYEINERYVKLKGDISALEKLKDILEQEQDPIGYKAREEAEKLRRSSMTLWQKIKEALEIGYS